jgi:signal transduction histidine kinase
VFKLCFYQRLALSLVAVFILLVTLFFWSTNYFQTLTRYEAEQRLHLGLAGHLVKNHASLGSDVHDAKALNRLFDSLMILGPNFEFYYLDEQGNVLNYSSDLGELQRNKISLTAIQQLLEGNESLPIFGDDPRQIGVTKIFSVAPVHSEEQLRGYIYIIIGGEVYDSILSGLQKSQSMREFAIFAVACIIFLLVILLVLFKFFTRPLRQLSEDMDKVRAADFQLTRDPLNLAVWNKDSQNEVQRLGCAFNDMLSHIDIQFEQLQKTEIQRTVLLADLSHDLRTPLANLQGYIETLAINGERLSAADRTRFIDITLKNAKNLKKLIDQIFELAYLDSGQVTVNNELFPLGELLHDVAAKFALKAQQKSIELAMTASQFDYHVIADIAKLERVLTNLLDNAIRHTPENGNIQIGVSKEENVIRIEVHDSGIGISSDEIEFIFDARYQATNSEKDNLVHAGLGLAISQRLMLVLGSKLTVESELGKGSCFSFELKEGDAQQ